jgi:hypothetical protein
MAGSFGGALLLRRRRLGSARERRWASVTQEKVPVGYKMIEVSKIRITEAGREARDREG